MIPILALIGQLRIEVVYAVVALLSVGNAFFDTSANALIPQIVPRDGLAVANSALMAGRETTVMLGPVVGGVLIGVVGIVHSLWVNAASFLVSAAAVLSLKIQPTVTPRTVQKPSSLREDLLIGFRYALSERVIRAISFRSFGVNLALGTIAILVFHYHHNVGLDEKQIGVGLGVGGALAIVGALAGARLGVGIGQGKAIVLFTVLEAAGLVVFGLVPSFLGLAIGNALVSAGVTGSNVNSAALRQAIAPGELRGRTWAFERTVSAASFPLGYIASGAGAEIVGAPTVFIAGGVLLGVLAAYSWRSSLRAATVYTLHAAQANPRA
jgi:MFS family permease